MTKPTIEAAIIEANRAKNPDKPMTDYDHRAKCMDILIEAARFRQPRKPVQCAPPFDDECECPVCESTTDYLQSYCCECGQALDWT